MLTGIRQSMGQLSLIGHGRTIAPGEYWQGFISFDLYTDQPIIELHVKLDGTRVAGQPTAPVELAFASERRPPRTCSDGKPATLLGVCPSDADGYDPAAAGPCIQETRSATSFTRKQIWIASAPVADSDLYATLQSAAPTRKLVNRGLKLRAAGWVLVGVGRLGSVATTVGLVRTDRGARRRLGGPVADLDLRVGPGAGLQGTIANRRGHEPLQRDGRKLRRLLDDLLEECRASLYVRWCPLRPPTPAVCRR